MPINIKDLGDDILSDAAQRLHDRLTKIDRTQQLIANGRGILAESSSRLRKYARREKMLFEEEKSSADNIYQESTEKNVAIGLERKIGKSNDILSIEFFELGLIAAKSVGRITLPMGVGTGFHVGHGVILTNHHVLNDPDVAEGAEFELNVEENKVGRARNIVSYSLNPKRFFLTNTALDFTLVALSNDYPDDPPIRSFGWHVLLDMQGKIRVGDPTNIIQHPNGNEKSVVVHNSHFLHLENGTVSEHFCWYSGDTEKGSSGAPVFNNRWEVVALHHKAVPKTNRNGDIVDCNGRAMSKERKEENPEDVAWVANEGIRASRIVQAIKGASINNPLQREIRDNLISLWSKPSAHKRGLYAATGD